MMMFITTSARDKARRGDGEYGRLYEGAEGRDSRGTHGQSLHWCGAKMEVRCRVAMMFITIRLQ